MSHRCPRRDEMPGSDERYPGPDEFGPRMSMTNGWSPGCTYCGSISGDAFMEFVRAGGTVVGTDKNYKAYVEKDTGVPAERYHETVTAPHGGTYEVSGVKDGTGIQNGKFYYQHLSQEQRQEFIDLYNAGKVNHSLYVWPFFMGAA